MRRIRTRSRLLSLVLALACSACLLQTGLAASPGRGSLSVKSFAGSEPVSGTSVSIWYIADYSGRWSGEFGQFGLTLETESGSKLSALANTLSALATRHGIGADYTGKTGEDGQAGFDNLPAGVWLVAASDYSHDNYSYKTKPSIVALGHGEDKTVELKHDQVTSPVDPAPDRTMRKVLKIWDDDGWTGRPSRVEAQLLRDGRVFDTQILCEANNWRYTWTDLDADHDWDVIELDVPDGYRATMDQAGVTTTITNRLVRDPGPDSTPESTPSPVPSRPVEPGQPVESDPVHTPGPSWPVWPTPGIDETPGPEPSWPVSTPEPNPEPTPGPGPNIPQTGTTWYLVPVLSGAGLVLILVGRAVRKGGKHDA